MGYIVRPSKYMGYIMCPNKYKGYIVCPIIHKGYIVCPNKQIGCIILATAGDLVFPGSDSETRSVSVIPCKKGDIIEISVHGLDLSKHQLIPSLCIEGT
jgi:hypothetical protein